MNWFLLIAAFAQVGLAIAIFNTDREDFIDSLCWRNDFRGFALPWFLLVICASAFVGIIVEVTK